MGSQCWAARVFHQIDLALFSWPQASISTSNGEDDATFGEGSTTRIEFNTAQPSQECFIVKIAVGDHVSQRPVSREILSSGMYGGYRKVHIRRASSEIRNIDNYSTGEALLDFKHSTRRPNGESANPPTLKRTDLLGLDIFATGFLSIRWRDIRPIHLR